MRYSKGIRYMGIAAGWAVVFLFLFPCFAMAEAQSKETGIISGKLINKTKSGSSVSDIEVSLRHFIGEKESEQKTTKTDQDGSFKFDGVSRDPNESYYLKVFYLGAEYNSKNIVFKDGKTHAGIDMVVFDSTDDEKGSLILN